MYRFIMVLVLGCCFLLNPVAAGNAQLETDHSLVVAYKPIQNWRQTTVLPEWRDTYELLLEQEMLV